MRDINLDDTYDLVIAGGDFQIANSDNQHVALLAATAAGSWKQSPAAGMGLNRFLLGEDNDVTKMLHIIDIQLKADGVTAKKVRISDGKLEIDAKY